MLGLEVLVRTSKSANRIFDRLHYMSQRQGVCEPEINWTQGCCKVLKGACPNVVEQVYFRRYCGDVIGQAGKQLELPSIWYALKWGLIIGARCCLFARSAS